MHTLFAEWPVATHRNARQQRPLWDISWTTQENNTIIHHINTTNTYDDEIAYFSVRWKTTLSFKKYRTPKTGWYYFIKIGPL